MKDKKMICPTCGHEMHNNTNLTWEVDKDLKKGKLRDEKAKFHSDLINEIVGELDMTV